MLKFANVAVDYHIDREYLAFFVPKIDLSYARLTRRQLHLIGTNGCRSNQLRIVDDNPWNAIFERENSTGIDRQLKPFGRLCDVTNHIRLGRSHTAMSNH